MLSQNQFKKTARIVVLFLLAVNMLLIPQASCKLNENNGLAIDVFTQKSPINGKGPNQPSDTFFPSELVILYSYVTYNGQPCTQLLVSYAIKSPHEDYSFYMTAFTNQSGIAMVSFRIPPYYNIEENIIFGKWTVNATVRIGEIYAYDTLSFKVGWIVTVKSIQTMDANLEQRNLFLKGDYVKIYLELENIALTSKNVTITITALDSSNAPIFTVEVVDEEIAPGVNNLLVDGGRIPITATPGTATLSVSLFTNPPALGGAPYSPAVEYTFVIATRDLAITHVDVSPTSVKKGESVAVCVVVKNEGDFTESFNVQIFLNHSLIRELDVKSLSPNKEETLNFEFSTQDLPGGNYTLIITVPALEGEYDLADNNFTTTIRVLEQVHDVAVSSVSLSKSEVKIGESVAVCVVVKNEGDFTESFNVQIFLNQTLMEVISVKNLAPGDERILNITINTSGLSEGNYLVYVIIPAIPHELSSNNNVYIDGIITLTARAFYAWNLVFLLLIIALILITLTFIYEYWRKRKKNKGKSHLVLVARLSP